ncbi:MAG: ATP-binding protein [Candidatus Anammoxibacter sp.]
MKINTLSNKLLIWFLITTLVPLALFGFAAYLYTVKQLKNGSIDHLVSLAETRALIIEDYFRRKEDIMYHLVHTPTIIDYMMFNERSHDKNSIISAENNLLDKKLMGFLESYTHGDNTLYDLFLVNKEGDVIFTMAKEEDYGTNLLTGPFKDTQLAKTFKDAIRLSSPGLSPFEYYPPSNEITSFTGMPIWNEGKLIGALCTQLDAKKIFEFAGNYIGLGDTGETVLASLKDDRVEIVAPLRHDPDAAFKRVIPVGSQKAIPIQLAAQAFDGVGISVDYRGKNVIAVWRYLHYSGWGMVIKIDEKEVFAPAQKYKEWMIYIGIITILCVILIVIYVSNSIASPIAKLTEAVTIIAEGDLSANVNIKSGDEIGKLSQSFNTMANNLQLSQQNLQKRSNELEESNRELDDFAFIASHDLKEPLRGIHNYASFLIEDYGDKIDEDGKKKLLTLKKLAQRLEALINDLLYFSRVGRSHGAYQETNLNHVLDEVLEMLQVRIKDMGIDVRRRDTLPTVFCDRSKIKDIFFNLITNAMKYNNKDEKWIAIGVDKSKHRNINTFYVNDNGIGIREKHIESIFKIFKRLHGRDKFGGGTGAGLTIVKKIVEQHGGKIWVESTVGEGTTFYFTLEDGGGSGN